MLGLLAGDVVGSPAIDAKGEIVRISSTTKMCRRSDMCLHLLGLHEQLRLYRPSIRCWWRSGIAVEMRKFHKLHKDWRRVLVKLDQSRFDWHGADVITVRRSRNCLSSTTFPDVE